jgi:hypothetical protein
MQQRGGSVQILVAVAASKDCPDTKMLSDDPHKRELRGNI